LATVTRAPNRVPVKRRGTILGLALLLSMVMPSATLAATYADCDGAGAYNDGFVFGRGSRDRADISNNFFKAAFGRAKIINLRACVNPNAPATRGKSFVFPANINASNNWLVQVGYGKVDCPTGYTCGWPDDQLSFIYTPDDSTYGVVAPFPGAETPEIGNVYSFKIESGATGFWLFTIRDETDNQTWTAAVSQDFSSGVSVIYGFEVARYWDQVGGITTARGKMYDLQYKRSDSTSWKVLTDDPYAACTPSSGVCIVEETLFGFHDIWVTNEEGTYDPDQTIVASFTNDH